MPEQTPQTPPYDLLPEVLKETFSFHFSFLTQPPDYRLDKRLVGPSPFMFYDRHVNESRRLRYVASLPSLVDDIIKKVDDRLEELERTGEGQLPMWYGTRAGFGVLTKGSYTFTGSDAYAAFYSLSPFGLEVWRLAVQKDTTVIVINCGNYERIGIRHRASQTLYLSDMIDLTKPGYGKLHLGTLMSVVDDALIRYQASCERDRTTRAKKRRHLPENNEVRRSKRQKLNILLERSRDLSQLSPQDLKVLWNEILKRPLLLLRFSGGGLHSSVPACCLRAGGALSPYVQDTTDYTSTTLRESYQASECFHLTLDWENSNGRTGQVFTGNLQLTLPNGRKLSRNVVAKIAYDEEAQDLVRHEYQVYRRLWSHGVRRIPEIYGLFEDVDNLATLLVMERAAYTFRQREPMTKENKGLLQEVQISERSTCMSIVKEIHDAGVVHRDIRAENLVVAQDGRPMVIDFDNALQDAPDHCKALEIESVEDLLSGKIFFRF
ncbi:hypothetical protein BDN72DRAFT_880180 [Pluteus cervinus]|uniref:Uncharacterized protein n=1 Tax=Pluteus cervinus TaxID=181527 RepID=A0ACD3AL08_9AGAR|nr:hypothetical protein BDN72DRAFT_880180 [Pluteus cervinus]